MVKPKNNPYHRILSNSRGGILLKLAIGIPLICGIAVIVFFNSGPADSRSRKQTFEESVKAGQAEIDNWPQTPEELIKAFWEAASRKDYDRLLILCPGSKVGDFKRYYDRWTPSPAKSIGEPEPHPEKPQYQMYPVKIDYPSFPNKTVKMAIGKLEDGRYVINGQYTIWW